MAGYLVLARKYRSQTFDQVVGQEPISTTLQNAIRNDRVAHAYLFTGTRGVGKTTMARILAKALNCLSVEQPTVEPCNQCASCEAIGRGDDVDVVEIDGASNRGIEEIRELRANAIFRPARGRYKIYYIDEVHMLTKEAFNALLKTLEEPPEHVKFIFATTEVEKVPATILSRCQRFDFRNIPTRKIAEHLSELCVREDVQADEEALFRVARAANGSMRDGLSLLDQLLAAAEKITAEEVIHILGAAPEERTLAIAGAIAAGQTAQALDQLDGMLQAGVTLSSVATGLGETFRNLMVARTCGPDSELIELPESRKQALAEVAEQFSTPAVVHAVAVLDNLTRTLRGSSVSRALAEAALVRLAEAEKFLDPESLLERLESLPAGGGPGQKKKPPLSRPARGGASSGGEPKRPVRVPGASRPGRGEPAARDEGYVAQPGPAGDDAPGPGAPAAGDDRPGEPVQPEAAEPGPQRRLSTEENEKLRRDPSVQKLMNLFEASGVEFHPADPVPPPVASADLLAGPEADALLDDSLDDADREEQED